MTKGRPLGTLKYDSVEELEKGIEEYFAECDAKGEPYTITGLALALNIDRKTINNYEKNSLFFPTIKKAKLKVENYLEKKLMRDSSATGVIFNLKNNFEWKDKQEIDTTAKVDMTYEDKLKKISDADEY